MTTPFADYSSLAEHIRALPSPRNGYLRVFRGQRKDYGSMRPTGIRVPLRNERVWRQYCGMLAVAMLIRTGSTVEEARSNRDLWAFWFYAIVQHYGPGTHLLDVTRSLDVALWFALHRATVDRRINLRYLASGPASHGPTLDRRDEWTTYQDSKETPGTVYVFDVPEWSPPDHPHHGALVDLAHAPGVFAASKRIQAQSACLVASDPKSPSGGDLTEFLACPPIPVKWPMTGSQAVHWLAEDLFPSPSEDEWYARLLFLPVVQQVWNEAPHWRMGHPVQLSLYIEHLEHSIQAVQFNPLQPPLLYCWLIAPALMNPPPNEEAYELAARYLRTVPILLEAPVIALLPNPDEETWYQARLASDLPDIIGVIDYTTGEVSDVPVLLNDVFFELSPLESVGWLGLLKPGETLRIPRAVHLVREDELEWSLQVFFQVAPKEQVETYFKEPASVRFHEPTMGFRIREKDAWKDISSNPVAAKCLFAALTLLRALSPNAADDVSFEKSIRTARAVLKRPPEVGLGLHYYVMRDSTSDDPYMGEPQ